MNEKNYIPIAKHLEDIDDLWQRRDAGLVPGQEGLAASMADSIYEHAVSGGFRTLIFCVSPKKRAQETANLVKSNIENKPQKLKVITEVDQNLREIDQGTFILPEGYIAGESFVGLKLAGKIFSAETFNPEDPSQDNLNYHFGDPLPRADGTDKYPELREYFSEPGESYSEVLLRFYSQIIKLSENMEKIKDRAEPIVFTHGQPHQIFTNLSEVADMIENDGFVFKTGELPRVCWNLYKANRKDVVPFGQMVFVSIEHICNPKMIDLLRREMEYLEGK